MACTQGFMGRACEKRRCAQCMDRRGADWTWTMRESLSAYNGPVLLVTLTAPGRSVLPMSDETGRCAWGPLSVWCGTLPGRWRNLRRSAQYSAGRLSGSGTVVLAYAWQLQGRGAPHVHIVVSADARGQAFASAIKAQAVGHGFGSVDIRTVTGSALAVVSYLSRYLARDYSATATATVYGAELMPHRLVYVATSLKRGAGVSIRVARKLRHLWAYANGRPVSMPTFDTPFFESCVYYWYRVGRRGRENVRRPDGLAVVAWSC